MVDYGVEVEGSTAHPKPETRIPGGTESGNSLGQQVRIKALKHDPQP